MGKTELVLGLAVALLLGVTMVPDAVGRFELARDAQRVQDLQLVADAIERWHADHGDWPPAQESADHGGWDVSNDGDFIPALVEAGYLASMPLDPVNDERYQYRYRVYEQGQYGCKGSGTYYVLGLRAFESHDFAEGPQGGFECLRRDWGQELAWLTGDGASYR